MSADGTWKTIMNTPMGAQEGTLELATDGGSLTGKLGGPQGEIELKDGTADGDNLAWKADITSPMALTLEFTATVRLALAKDLITGHQAQFRALPELDAFLTGGFAFVPARVLRPRCGRPVFSLEAGKVGVSRGYFDPELALLVHLHLGKTGIAAKA